MKRTGYKFETNTLDGTNVNVVIMLPSQFANDAI